MTLEEMQAALDTEKAKTLELGDKLTAANSEAASRRNTAKELKDQLALFGDIDPDQVKALQTKAAQLEQDRLKGEGKFEEALAEALKGKDSEIAQLKEMVQGKDASLSKLTIDNTFLGAIDGKAVNSDQVLALVRGNIKMEEGSPVVYENGAPKLNGKGDRMSVADYGLEFLATNPHLALPDGGGSGSQGNNGNGGKGGNVMNRTDFSKLDPSAQAAHCKGGGTIID